MEKLADYRLDPPEYAPEWNCSECGADLYGGENVYFFEDEQLCEDCFVKRVLSAEAFRACRIPMGSLAEALAEVLLIDVMTAKEVRELGG